jgi:hypothetical protein
MRVDGIVNKSGTVDSSFSQVLQFVVGLGAMHNAINHQTKPNQTTIIIEWQHTTLTNGRNISQSCRCNTNNGNDLQHRQQSASQSASHAEITKAVYGGTSKMMTWRFIPNDLEQSTNAFRIHHNTLLGHQCRPEKNRLDAKHANHICR